MDEIINNGQLEEAQSPEMTDDALKEAIQTQMKKVQLASMLNGSKAICGVILQYIKEFQLKPGKKTYRDYERLVKKISDFCSVSLGKAVNENGDIVNVDSTKLSEEVDPVAD